MRTRLVAALAAASVALTGCGFQGLYSAPLPGGADLGDHPYDVTIEFANVLDLVPQSAVKVNDVAVGKVRSVALGSDHGKWVANVTVAVNGKVKLPDNARAAVLQTTLLGEKYVALMQPTSAPSSTRLHNGSRIGIDRTSSAPEAEQVFGALSLLLNQGGLTQIRAIATELNKALAGKDRQAAVRDLIGQLNTFVSTLDGQKDGIVTALENVDTLAKTLNKQKKVLTQALDTFPAALKVLSGERGQLVHLLTSLSDLGVVATRVIGATQSQLVTSLKALNPVVRSLTAVGDPLVGSLRIGLTFPFPLGTARQLVNGDYANLDAVLNLNLTDQLCGSIGLCGTGSSSAAKKLAAGVLKKLLPGVDLTGLLPLSQHETALAPTLIGAGK